MFELPLRDLANEHHYRETYTIDEILMFQTYKKKICIIVCSRRYRYLDAEKYISISARCIVFNKIFNSNRIARENARLI